MDWGRRRRRPLLLAVKSDINCDNTKHFFFFRKERFNQAFFWTPLRVLTSSRFAVEVCFSIFRPEFYQNWPEFCRNFYLSFRKWVKNWPKISIFAQKFAVQVTFFHFWNLSFGKISEFSKKPEFFSDLSFSQSVQKKSLDKSLVICFCTASTPKPNTFQKARGRGKHTHTMHVYVSANVFRRGKRNSSILCIHISFFAPRTYSGGRVWHHNHAKLEGIYPHRTVGVVVVVYCRV